MIMRQYDPACIKAQRPSEQLSRSYKDMVLRPVCDYLLCNNFSGGISEDCYHPFIG